MLYDAIISSGSTKFGVLGQEFANLKPENTIYKLIGPALVVQDQDEAKTNVNTRLEFIRGEMSVRTIIDVN